MAFKNNKRVALAPTERKPTREEVYEPILHSYEPKL